MAEISELAVGPDFRKRGIARQIFGAVLQELIHARAFQTIFVSDGSSFSDDQSESPTARIAEGFGFVRQRNPESPIGSNVYALNISSDGLEELADLPNRSVLYPAGCLMRGIRYITLEDYLKIRREGFKSKNAGGISKDVANFFPDKVSLSLSFDKIFLASSLTFYGPFHRILVAYHEGKVVGYTKIHLEYGVGQIDEVAVDGEYRRNRIGTSLVSEALDELREMGAVSAYLIDGSREDATGQLATKLGFKRLPRYPYDDPPAMTEEYGIHLDVAPAPAIVIIPHQWSKTPGILEALWRLRVIDRTAGFVVLQKASSRGEMGKQIEVILSSSFAKPIVAIIDEEDPTHQWLDEILRQHSRIARETPRFLFPLLEHAGGHRNSYASLERAARQLLNTLQSASLEQAA